MFCTLLSKGVDCHDQANAKPLQSLSPIKTMTFAISFSTLQEQKKIKQLTVSKSILQQHFISGTPPFFFIFQCFQCNFFTSSIVSSFYNGFLKGKIESRKSSMI